MYRVVIETQYDRNEYETEASPPIELGETWATAFTDPSTLVYIPVSNIVSVIVEKI